MIERVFDFCFGSQRHKYATLVLATAIAATCTISVVGVAAGPKSAPVIAILAVLFAVPISAALHLIERESSELVLSRGVALRLSKTCGVDETLVGDLAEYHKEIRERFGVRRANTWYRLQVLSFLFYGPRLRMHMRVWLVLTLVLAIEVYVFTTPNGHVHSAYEVFVEFFYMTVIAVALLGWVGAWATKVDDDFEQFRAKRGHSDHK